MLLDKEVEVTLNGKVNVKYYESLGYKIPRYKDKGGIERVKKNTKIIVKTEDLQLGSNVIVNVICDLCNKEHKTSYNTYIKSINCGGYYSCKDCSSTKQKELTLIKYGVENVFQLKEVKEKAAKTNMNKFGTPYPSSTNLIKEKTKQTVLSKYGVEYLSQSPEIREKITNVCLEKYGVEHVKQYSLFKQKASNTMYKNGSCPTSKQQVYLNSLYHGILNYSCSYYNLDIYLQKECIDIEYDGSGHNLDVLFGSISKKEFLIKEITRSRIIKCQNINSIHIISKTDKLPSDNILLDILNISKEYFNTTNHTWVEWYLDENKMRNAENKDGIFYDFGQLKRVS